MNNDTFENLINKAADTHNAMQPENAALPISLEGIVARIDAIIQDKEHIASAFNALLSDLPDSTGYRARALGEIVSARESTNRQMLQLLEKIYNDLNQPN